MLKEKFDSFCVSISALTEVRRSTECNDQIQPACGSDGQTYSNDCQFHCAQAANKGKRFDPFFLQGTLNDELIEL